MPPPRTSFAALLLLPVLVLGNYNFGLERLTGRRIPSSKVDTILPGNTLDCECWRSCRLSPSCRAVTAVPVRGNIRRCEMTSQFLVPSSLEDAVPVGPDDVEYVTYMKVCKEVFVGVEGAGCFFFSVRKVSFSDAKIACPHGSKLASPSNMTIFDTLVNYLKTNTVPAPFWVDIQKINGVWTWGDNTIDQSGQSMGEGPWSTGYPRSTGEPAYAQMWKMYGYRLVDSSSFTVNEKFICEQQDQF